MINKSMKKSEKKKPDDVMLGSTAAKLVIREKKTDKIIVKTRG